MKTALILIFSLCLAVASAAQKVPSTRYPVVIVMLENHSYSSMYVPSVMPHLVALGRAYGVPLNFDANGHESIGNYMFLTFGRVETMIDNYDPNTKGYFSDDNIIRHILTLGKTYKMYEESIDHAGSDEMSSANGLYLRRHNPLSYTSEFGNMTSAQRAAVEVPFTQFAKDLAAHQLPDFAFVTPNVTHDAHNGIDPTRLQIADSWLQSNVFTPLLADPNFQQTGMLIISVDESFTNDCLPDTKCPPLPEFTPYCTSHCAGGGGHILTVLIGPNVKPGSTSPTRFMHESTLKSMLTALGDTSRFPGGLSAVPDFGTFYQLLVNPGFELSSINWYCNLGNACVIGNQAGRARTGRYYAELKAGAGAHPTYSATDGNGKVIYYPVTPGQTVTFSGWASRVSGNGRARLVIELTDASKTNPEYVLSNPSNVTSAAWTETSSSFVVPAGKAFLRFYMEIYEPTTSSEVLFDDLSLEIQ